MQRVHAVVSGRVQGVGFRQWVAQQANRLSLTGWVRNTDDGKVELFADGSEHSIQGLIELLPKGPPLSEVKSISQKLSDLTESEYDLFEVRR